MNIEQTVSAAVAGLQLGSTFTLDDLLTAVQQRRHRRLRVVELADLDTRDGICAVWLVTDTDDIPPYTRGRLLKRQDIDCETEIAAESLADRLAAGIRGSVFAETRYSEVFG
nr:hypothetical protein [Propionicimonas sp.]